VERLKAALENLDQAIDMAEASLERRNKALDRIVEEKSVKRIKVATDTADRALRQARHNEEIANERSARQRELTGAVAGRLDHAILRLEKIAGG
jgi:hypothetical protein